MQLSDKEKQIIATAIGYVELALSEADEESLEADGVLWLLNETEAMDKLMEKVRGS